MVSIYENLTFLAVVVQLFLFQYVRSSLLDHDGALTIKIEHSLNFNKGIPILTERGNISVQSTRIGQTLVNQKHLTPTESQLLNDLAESNQFYQIRAFVNEEGNERNKFISTLKACMIAESELDDRLSISLDYTGRVVAISDIIASKSSCEGASMSLEKLKYFTSTVYVRHTEMGPVPDTASYIQRLEREKEAKEKGEGKDNRSFLAKYWMYIVPVVIIMVISSGSNAENTGASN
ncbi:hypothetical protein HHI36_002912 [Cryptolaemus montrouzieri]|uniref:ER membrane protein complex subunit 10 n=1 Tax=Cryptolaemus montrouzieri TaxID=559131 RepID=A0ABD2PCE5_9CUCU